MFRTLVTLALVLTFTSSAQAENLVIRAAFDIGSGTTKMKVALVDIERQVIIKSLIEGADVEREVDYGSALAKTLDNNTDRNDDKIGKKLLDKGIRALKELRAIAVKVGEGYQKAHPELDLGPMQYAAVATEAFRVAKDRGICVSCIFEEVGIQPKIISARREALLGYSGALAKFPKISRKDLVVWDTGARSTQIVMSRPNERPQFLLTRAASVSMKRCLLKNHAIQIRPNPESPNPVGAVTKEIGVEWTKNILNDATYGISDELRESIKGATVVGIGGVHFYSVLNQAAPEKNEYTIEDVRRAIAARINLDDTELAEVKSPELKSLPASEKKKEILKKALQYVDMDVGNLILILAFMEELGIEKVRTAYVTLTDGVLVDPLYWRKYE